MHTEINREITGFSWEIILASSQEFKRNPFNPSVFENDRIANIAIRRNEIVAIHPFEIETLNRVSEKLSAAVSQYYKENVSVTIIKESMTIKVCFSE